MGRPGDPSRVHRRAACGSTPSVPAEYLQQALAEILAPTSQDAITENHRHARRSSSTATAASRYIDTDGDRAEPDDPAAQPPTPRTTSTSRSTRSPSARGSTSAASTSCSTSTGCRVAIIELKKAGVGAGRRRRRARAARRPTCASSRWRSGSASSRWPATASSPGTARRSRPLNHFSPWNVDDDGKPVAFGRPASTATHRHRAGVPHRRASSTRSGSSSCCATSSPSTGRGRPRPSGSPSRTSTSPSPRPSAAPSQAVESNGKAGVVWHTQGSGKSMEMELYANLVMRHPKLLEPDDRRHHRPQRARRAALRGVRPQPAAAREARCRSVARSELRDELTDRTTGGIYFTTLQKFGRTEDERDAGARPPAALRPAQHHRHRRRGAPQPLRRPRRVRPPPQGRPAERHAHRVHRHARSRSPTATPARCSATTSTSTT